MRKLLICTLQETPQASGKQPQQGKGPRFPNCRQPLQLLTAPRQSVPARRFPRCPTPPAPGRYLPVFPVAEYPVSVGRVDLHSGLVDHLDAALLVRAAERPHPAVDLGKGTGQGTHTEPVVPQSSPEGRQQAEPPGTRPPPGASDPSPPSAPASVEPGGSSLTPTGSFRLGLDGFFTAGLRGVLALLGEGGRHEGRAGPGPAAGQGLGRGLMGWGGDLRRLHVAESRSGRS